MNKEVAAQARKAYTDCWHEDPNGDYAIEQRNLGWRATQDVSKEEAFDIFDQYIPRGYNDFEADLLKKLPQNCRVILAREGSPCIYVNTPISTELAEQMLADECHGGITVNDIQYQRLWWD